MNHFAGFVVGDSLEIAVIFSINDLLTKNHFIVAMRVARKRTIFDVRAAVSRALCGDTNTVASNHCLYD